MTTRGSALLRGNVLWLSVVSLLNDAASEMIYPLLPIFLASIGGGPVILGVIEGIAESTASLVKLASGWLSDRRRRRKPLILWGYSLAALTRPLLSLATAPWHILAVRFSDRIGKGLRSAPRDALLAASVSADRRGRAFGIHRAADHAGSVIGPLVAAGLLLLMPGQYRFVFAAALVPGLVTVATIFARVTEQRTSGDAGPAMPAAGSVTPSLQAPAIQDAGAGTRSILPVLAVFALFTLGNATDAFLLLRAGQLGVSVVAIPLLWALLHVSKMTFNVVGGTLSDRFGPGRSIVAGWLVYALVYAGFAFGTSIAHAYILFLVYGLFYGLTEAPEKALIAALSHEHGRGAAFGAYHFAIGIAALPASVLFGVVWSGAGAHWAFLMGAGIALVSAFLLPFALRSHTRVPA
ncbi:MAG TPA: MFS transporter [Longimicrobiales bacterium]